MSLALFLAHLKSSRWGIVAWVAIIFVYALLVIYLYPTVADTFGTEYYQILPDWLKQALGLEDVDLSGGLPLSIYVTTEFLAWWPLLVGIYAIFAAGGIVAREMDKGTLGLLLSQPLRRSRLLSSKFAAFCLALIFIGIAAVAGIALGFALIDVSASLGGICLAVVEGLCLVLAIGSYSLLFSCIFLDPRRTLTASGLLTAAFYILSFIAPILGRFDWLSRLSLFYYYRPGQIVDTATPDWAGLGIYLGLTAVCFIASLRVFQRRDIAA